MSEQPDDSDNFCYRHPDRQSYILCQRCGRTVCPQCSTQAAVGVHCPECVKEQRAAAVRRRPVTVRAVRTLRDSSKPVVTYAIIAICLVVFAAQFVFGTTLTSVLVYWPPVSFTQPWRLLTALVSHGSVLHLLMNMVSLFIVGRMLEPYLGRIRYLALFVVAGLGGSAALALISFGTAALGASGAIFGLFGALFVLIRHFGGNASQIVIVVAINLVIGFTVPGIAWEAHLGGLLAGAAVAFVYTRTRGTHQRVPQALMVAGIGVASLVLIALQLYS